MCWKGQSWVAAGLQPPGFSLLPSLTPESHQLIGCHCETSFSGPQLYLLILPSNYLPPLTRSRGSSQSSLLALSHLPAFLPLPDLCTYHTLPWNTYFSSSSNISSNVTMPMNLFLTISDQTSSSLFTLPCFSFLALHIIRFTVFISSTLFSSIWNGGPETLLCFV